MASRWHLQIKQIFSNQFLFKLCGEFFLDNTNHVGHFGVSFWNMQIWYKWNNHHANVTVSHRLKEGQGTNQPDPPLQCQQIYMVLHTYIYSNGLFTRNHSKGEIGHKHIQEAEWPSAGLEIGRSQFQVPLWPTAGFVSGSSCFNSSATLVHVANWSAPCQLGS